MTLDLFFRRGGSSARGPARPPRLRSREPRQYAVGQLRRWLTNITERRAGSALPIVNASRGNGVVTVTIDAASPSGECRWHRARAGVRRGFPGRQDHPGFVQRAHGDLHPSDVHHHQLLEPAVCLPVSRLGVRYGRPGRARTGGHTPASVPDAVRQQRLDHYRMMHSAEHREVPCV